MLQNIREKTSGWIAYVIIGLISIPFVLAGITSYFGGGDLAPAATVDGEQITSRQLDYAYANYERRLKSLFGGTIPEALDNEAVLKEQVRDQLIDEQVLMKFIADNNFRLGDQALNNKITSMDIFKDDGHFSSALYQGQLSSQGISPQQFEEDLRRSEEMLQVRRAINSTAIHSTVRKTEKQNLKRQERKVRSLVLPVDIASVAVTEDDLSKEYNANSKHYMTTEKVKIDYIELNIETLKSSTVVTDDEVRDYYEQTKEDLVAPEIREASHILLKLNEDDSDQVVAEKKQLADKLKQQLDNGDNFAALARENSQDPGSASEGGDLGEIEKGMMVKPFEDALFALKEGEISEPIRSKFGWHIIKLNTVSGGVVPTFEAKKDELAEQLKTEKAENKIYELSESLSNLTYEQPDSLVPAAEQLDLKVKTSGWFERNKGEGIASNAKVRNLAFSSAVLKEDRNSDALELGDNHLLVMHLNEYKPSALPPLSESKVELTKTIKIKKARFQAAEDGKKGLELARSSGLGAVETEWKQTIKDNGFIKRDSTVDQRDIVNLAFRMAKPNGSPVYQGIELVTGDYAIVEVSDVKVDEAIVASEEDKKPQTESFEYQAWLKHKVSEADIVKTPLSELQ